MPLSAADRADTMRQLIKRMFVDTGNTAVFSTADLLAAVISIDDSFDTLASSLNQSQTIAQNMNARLPEPVKGDATLAQKSLIVAYVALKRAGLI